MQTEQIVLSVIAIFALAHALFTREKSKEIEKLVEKQNDMMLTLESIVNYLSVEHRENRVKKKKTKKKVTKKKKTTKKR